MDITPTRLEEFVFEDDATLEVLRNVVANDNLLPAARVGVLLYGGYGTGKTTLARLYRDIPVEQQEAVLYMPADSRFIEHKSRLNDLLLHRVPWIREAAEAVDADPCITVRANTDPPDLVTLATPPAANGAEYLREIVNRLRNDSVIDIGGFIVDGEAEMHGSIVNGDYLAEDVYRSLRDDLINRGADPADINTFPADVVDVIARIFDRGAA